MEQQQYNPDYVDYGFQPDQAPDRNVGSAANQSATANANQAMIAQMRADAQTMAINDRRVAEGEEALAKFSQSLTKKLEKEAYRKADEDFAEGLLYAYENPGTLQPEEEDDGKPALDAAGRVLAADPSSADIVVPAVRGSRFFQKGVRQGQVLGLLQTQYTPFVENYVREKNPQNAQELAVAQAEARQQFWARASVDRSSLSNNFLLRKLFPMMTKMDNSLSKTFTDQITSEQSFATQNEAVAAFTADGDVAKFLATQAATTDAQGNILGYRGAWKNFSAMLTNGITSGTFTEADVQAMRNQKIPGDPKGRTYGELHGLKFDKALKLAADARRAEWRESQADRQIEFEQQEQQLLDAFGGTDADGYTTEQIEEAADKLEAANPGFTATRLRGMATGSVDAKEREKQEQQIKDLKAMGLLTPERLRKFDRRLWSKYMTDAQAQAKAAAAAGDYKEPLKVVEDMVKRGPDGATPIKATADGRQSESVRMVSMQMKQYFLKKVQEYQISNPDNAVALALNDTRQYFNDTYKDKVDPQGYTGVFGTPQEVQNARIAADARIGDIDDAMKNPNFLEPDNKSNIFTKPELEQMVVGYGKPGWKIPPAITYIAAKQGIDPLTVINKLRAQQGLDELEPTPASKVVANELTPAQRAALANIGTPSVSTRTMGSLGWRSELVPNGYGPLVEKAATANGLQPAQIAAMAEIESNWDPNTPSYNNSSFGLMQINRAAHPQFFANKNWRDPQESLNYGAQYFASLVKRYNGDLKAAAMAYNGGPANYDAWARGDYVDPDVKREMVSHGKKYMKALYKYGGGPAGELNGRGYQRTQRTSNVPYIDQRTAANGYGDRQCFSAVGTMLANAYGVPISYDDYNTRRSRYGDTTLSSAQVGILRELGISASVSDNGSMQELTQLASGNKPVAIGIQHDTGKGHWILVTGVTPNGDFIVNDPFGELVQQRGGGWKYANSGGNQAGKGVVYTADFLRQVWVDRGAGTGRIMRVS